jgi:hypothetical protein
MRRMPCQGLRTRSAEAMRPVNITELEVTFVDNEGDAFCQEVVEGPRRPVELLGVPVNLHGAAAPCIGHDGFDESPPRPRSSRFPRYEQVLEIAVAGSAPGGRVDQRIRDADELTAIGLGDKAEHVVTLVAEPLEGMAAHLFCQLFPVEAEVSLPQDPPPIPVLAADVADHGPSLDGQIATGRADGSSIPWHTALIIRTLALLTISEGAKLGANVHRHRATSGDVQRFSLRPEPTSGDTGRRQATLGKCLLVRESAPGRLSSTACGPTGHEDLSSRSRVRVALGAPTKSQVRPHEPRWS